MDGKKLASCTHKAQAESVRLLWYSAPVTVSEMFWRVQCITIISAGRERFVRLLGVVLGYAPSIIVHWLSRDVSKQFYRAWRYI